MGIIQTPNYGFDIPDGNQVVNPLVQTFPNWSDLDTLLRSVEDKTITTATELKTGSVHALNRADTDADCFRFVATSNFTAGETFLLDGEQVTALTVSGEQLSTGAYVIGSNVLVMVHDTLLSFIVPETTSKDSEKLGGELPSFYGKQSDITQLDTDMNAINTKVGAGVLQTEAQNCVGAINELNTHLTPKTFNNLVFDPAIVTVNSKNIFTIGKKLYVDVFFSSNVTISATTNIANLTGGSVFDLTNKNGGVINPLKDSYGIQYWVTPLAINVKTGTPMVAGDLYQLVGVFDLK